MLRGANAGNRGAPGIAVTRDLHCCAGRVVRCDEFGAGERCEVAAALGEGDRVGENAADGADVSALHAEKAVDDRPLYVVNNTQGACLEYFVRFRNPTCNGILQWQDAEIRVPVQQCRAHIGELAAGDGHCATRTKIRLQRLFTESTDFALKRNTRHQRTHRSAI